jgi:hypothetical protein
LLSLRRFSAVISAPRKRLIGMSRILTSSAPVKKVMNLLFTLPQNSIILAVPILSTLKQIRILAKQEQGTRTGPPGPISPHTSFTLEPAIQSLLQRLSSAGTPGISVMMEPVGFAPKTCPGTLLVEDVRSGKRSGALRALFKKDVLSGGTPRSASYENTIGTSDIYTINRSSDLKYFDIRKYVHNINSEYSCAAFSSLFV